MGHRPAALLLSKELNRVIRRTSIMKIKFFIVFHLAFFIFGYFSVSTPYLKDGEKDNVSVLVLLGEWFGDTYFPLKEEIDRREWTMKRIGVDAEYRGCYNKARDVVLTSDILIPDFKDFSPYDCLIIPSGPQWRKFNQNPVVIQFLKDAHESGLLIASFCVGNTTVQAAGLIDPTKGEELFPHKVTLVKDGILLGPRGGGPPPGDGFKSAPIREICDAIENHLEKGKGVDSPPELKGPYLGQNPPGMTPEIFAPGIVSTKEHKEFSGTFAPDGMEYYFFRFADGAGMMTCKLTERGWTMPRPAVFNTEYIDNEPHITPDGKRMYFNSNRPYPGSTGNRRPTQIWYMDRMGDHWGEPRHLCMGMFANTSRNGNVYLGHRISRMENGKLVKLTDIAGAMKSPPAGWKPGNHGCIAPDESYLIYDSQKVDSSWDSDSNLFISFRKSDGSWSESYDLGCILKLPGSKWLATITADGRYLFFGNNWDIYWVDAGIIDQLKPPE